MFQARAACLAIVLAASLSVRAQGDAASGGTGATNGFYVWQRHWSDNVEAAVRTELESGTHGLYLLGGELESESERTRWRGVEVPEDLWRHRHVTAVFRIPVRALDDPRQTAAAVVARAEKLGVCRIQLDADVPERLIVRYAELAEGIRRNWSDEMGSLRLGATFLPCHLNMRDMRRVLVAVDEPVVQLHGITAPKKHAEGWALMNRETAFRALRAARALDGRFRMALPTYAYVLTFGPAGDFRRLYAEGLPDDFDPVPGTIREIASPDLKLLCEILRSPLRLPVIWFRLPVHGGDRWCLERDTLALLERGECPRAALEFKVRGGGRPGTVDLFARYRHQIPLDGVVAAVDWGENGAGGEFFPLNGCRIADETAHGRLPISVRIPPHACGESFVFGKAITQVDVRKISVVEMERRK